MPLLYQNGLRVALLEGIRALAAQDLDLFTRAAGVTAGLAVGTNHAMARHLRSVWIIVHDIPHRPRGTRIPRPARHFGVRHHTPARDLCHDSVNFFSEGCW